MPNRPVRLGSLLEMFHQLTRDMNLPEMVAITVGNALLTMSTDPLDNSIKIPGVFIQYDTVKKN
jgi:hypothetical protein